MADCVCFDRVRADTGCWLCLDRVRADTVCGWDLVRDDTGLWSRSFVWVDVGVRDDSGVTSSSVESLESFGVVIGAVGVVLGGAMLLVCWRVMLLVCRRVGMASLRC